MTRGEIKALARTWLDDLSGGYFTDTIMDRFINQAQRECQKLLLQAGEDFYTICVYTTTVVDQRDYALPSDFVKLMRLERVTQGSGDTAATVRLWPLERNEIDVADYNAQSDSTGLPWNYVINKASFSLYPVPNAAKTIKLWYAPRVADMDDDADIPDVPEDYHEYLAILAARDGFLRDGRPLTPIESKLAYYEKMMEESSENRNVDSPRMVNATPEGFGAL